MIYRSLVALTCLTTLTWTALLAYAPQWAGLALLVEVFVLLFGVLGYGLADGR